MARKSLKKFKKLVDHNEYGGAPLLGVNGAAFIAHGGASSKALTSAILVAKHFVEKGIIHSSDVSTILHSSSFVNTFLGTKEPIPVIFE